MPAPAPRLAPVTTATQGAEDTGTFLLSVGSADDRGHGIPAPEGRCARATRVVHVDGPLGESLEYLFERDAALEAGQWGADAEVGSAAESQVTTRPTADVEPVGVLEVPFVAVGRGEHQQYRTAGRHDPLLERDILGCDVARDVWPGGLEAQQFLDGRRDQGVVFGEFLALVGVFGEDFAHPPEQPAGGLDTGAGDDRE